MKIKELVDPEIEGFNYGDQSVAEKCHNAMGWKNQK